MNEKSWLEPTESMTEKEAVRVHGTNERKIGG
jgi:hypothetical protein